MIDARIYGDGKHSPKVTKYGELVVSAGNTNTVSSQALDAVNTGVMFVRPEMGSAIIINQIIIAAEKSVSSSTSAEVIVYESTTGTGTAEHKRVLKMSIIKNQTESFSGLNLLVEEGLWVMAKTDDATVDVSILYNHLK